MPIGCKSAFGSRKKLKNHNSAISFKNNVDNYIRDNLRTQALLGPFNHLPIPDMCFSPMLTVPKEKDSRRVVIDFSFPPGRSINDGISKTVYLDFAIEFSLPSVQSMVGRLNELGPGCLLYKRDLKSAFRQFPTDPGDYNFACVEWDGLVYMDTRLAMGLRSSAFCCQAVTEMVAKVTSKYCHSLVYLDDFGGAERPEDADSAFELLGKAVEYFGLKEANDKAVAPTTQMDWLGIRLDTKEWTMALKPGKLEELLDWLPRLLKVRRVRKVMLQKILGNLVWASAVVRAGKVFFNRLLALLRKLHRSHHSIYFSSEAKKDVKWWLKTLESFNGKCPIPPAVWTPLTDFSTDASLDGFGMVWGTRAVAGLFTLEFDDLDINCKEMLAIMGAAKLWFPLLANLRIRIFSDNQVCVALLNNGFKRSPFLAQCLREIQFLLATYNIEVRAQYIPSKENYIADLCSRAFMNDVYFKNFNQLLNDKTIVLEVFNYDYLSFQCNW